tara:strand:- start:236 stop:526 length:291 start_codon:yes stop_codon:yes gene_type:complete
MLFQKYVKFIQFIEIFDQMSKDLDIGRLTNHEKDTLLSLYRSSKDEKNIDIRSINFISYNGTAIPRSTLYKALKSLCDKNIIKRLGSQRSSIYKLK